MNNETSNHASPIAPLELPASILRVGLEFDLTPEGPQFVLDSGNEIEVPPGLCMVVLGLSRASDAAFLTHPISWFEADCVTPSNVPEPIIVRREHHGLLTLLDNNPGEIEHVFNFRISLISKGEVFTSPDPTIINRKPYRAANC